MILEYIGYMEGSWEGVLLSAIFGMLLGSFVSLVSYRLPREEDIVVISSRCPQCRHTLRWKDLVPVFSWAMQGGKCAYCKKTISFRYPLIEIVLGVLFACIFWKVGISPLMGILWGVTVCLMVMVVVDFEFRIIPDSVQLALAFFGILFSLVTGKGWIHIMVAPIIGLVVSLLLRYGFFVWKKKEGLGLGDVKFFAVAGLFLEWELVPIFLLLSGVLGIILGIGWKKLKKEEEFPFGPALAVALWICAVFPEVGSWLLLP